MSSNEPVPTPGVDNPAPQNPPANNPTLTISDAFKQVKAVVAPFRQIYGITLETGELRLISHIVRDDPSYNLKSDSNVPIYTVYACDNDEDDDASWAKGRKVFPADISPEMQTAILKFSTCDYSVYSFLPLIANALQKIGALVGWGLVLAKPLFLLHYAETKFSEPMHSMLYIRAASGEEFVADLSIEQFGHSGDTWFTTGIEYLEKYTQDQIILPARPEDFNDLESRLQQSMAFKQREQQGGESKEEKNGESQSQEKAVNGFFADLHTTARTVCEMLDWEHCYSLPANQREAWLDMQTRNILGPGSF